MITWTLAAGQVIPFAHDLDAEISNALLEEKLIKKSISAIGEKGQLFKEKLDKFDKLSAADIAKLFDDG